MPLRIVLNSIALVALAWVAPRPAVAQQPSLPAPSSGELPPPTAQAPEEVRFTFRPEPVGQRWLSTSLVDLKLRLDVRRNGKITRGMTQGNVRQCQKVVTALASSEKGPTKLQVFYRQSEEAEANGSDNKVASKDPVAGKTYLVQRRDERIIVTDAVGREVSDAEKTQVVLDHQDLGQQDPLAALLAGRRLRIGEKLDLKPDQAHALMGLTHGDGEVKKFEMTLAGTRQVAGMNCAAFDIVGQIKSEANHSLVDLSGQFYIAVDSCRWVWLDLSGPVKLDSQGPKHAIEGTGSLRHSVRMQYEKK